MQIYNNSDSGTLYQGDCLEVLRWLPSDSMDTMITDPPYGLSFMGKKWDYDVPGVDVWKECLRVLKPGATALIFAGSRTQHRMAVNVEDAGFILKDTIMWIYGSGFPKSTDISKQIDKVAGARREIIGKGQYADKGRTANQQTNSMGAYSSSETDFITAPTTNEAKTWNGWGTALKPAYEPILVAMKPNDGTYAQNALKHGVAGFNIDGGRIAMVTSDFKAYKEKRKSFDNTKGQNIYGGNALNTSITQHTNRVETKGRFPANIILDEEVGQLLDEQSGILKSGGGNKRNTKPNLFRGKISHRELEKDYKSQGGASRFFYCAKASKSERNGNSHPTVKPLALMEYLVKLTATPSGGSVFDPFAGSGTTGIACILNGRSYTLIEKEIDYCEIIMARLGHAWFKNLY